MTADETREAVRDALTALRAEGTCYATSRDVARHVDGRDAEDPGDLSVVGRAIGELEADGVPVDRWSDNNQRAGTRWDIRGVNIPIDCGDVRRAVRALRTDGSHYVDAETVVAELDEIADVRATRHKVGRHLSTLADEGVVEAWSGQNVSGGTTYRVVDHDGAGREVRADGGWPDDEWVTVRSVRTYKEAYGPVDERTSIDTREGEVVAEPGDYVIRESDGNHYPIAPDKFSEFYKVVTDGPTSETSVDVTLNLDADQAHEQLDRLEDRICELRESFEELSDAVPDGEPRTDGGDPWTTVAAGQPAKDRLNEIAKQTRILRSDVPDLALATALRSLADQVESGGALDPLGERDQAPIHTTTRVADGGDRS